MFFSFEGVEGSGKSTLIKRLEAYLIDKGYDVVCTREWVEWLWKGINKRTNEKGKRKDKRFNPSGRRVTSQRRFLYTAEKQDVLTLQGGPKRRSREAKLAQLENPFTLRNHTYAKTTRKECGLAGTSLRPALQS